jgi:hypothetical protein
MGIVKEVRITGDIMVRVVENFKNNGKLKSRIVYGLTRYVNDYDTGPILGEGDYKGNRYKDMSSDEIIADWLHVNSASDKIPKGSEITQDPWAVNIARKRNFGSDLYHLNNGTRVDIRWTSPDFGASSSQVDENGDTTYFGRTVGPYTMLGGEQWSDDEGNELALPDGVSPTQSYYSDGSIGDGNGLIIYQSIKSRIIKSVTIRTPSDPSFDPQWKTEESVLYITEDNLLELSTKVGYEQTYDEDTGKYTTIKLEKQEKKYTGNVDDVDIINDILSAWNKKVPNYNVGQCELIDPQETSEGRWPAKDGNTNKTFGNGVACNIHVPGGGAEYGAFESTPAKNEKGLYYSGTLVQYKSPIKPLEVEEEADPVIAGSQSGDVESKKNIITFNVELDGVFLPLSSGGTSSTGTSSTGVASSPSSPSSIIVDSKIGRLTLIEDNGFVFQDDFEQLGELDAEFSESGFKGVEESEHPEDSEVDDEVSQAADSFAKTTTFVPSGNYDLDLIPGTYLDNNKNPIELCEIDGSVVNVKIAEAYLQMRDAAKAAGIKLRISSAFRSPFDGIKTKSAKGKSVAASSQDFLYTSWIKQEQGKKSYVYNGTSARRKGQTITLGRYNLAAKAGRSNHGSGIGLDLNAGGSSKRRFSGVKKDIYIWLVKNSWKFGFVRAVNAEEWHFDYLPSKAKLGPYGKLNGGKPQKDTGSVRTKFYSDYGLDNLQAPNWGSTITVA